MNGIVQSGGMSSLQITPLGGAQVTLYEATSSTPNAIGTATSKADGTFTIATSSDTSTSVFYATATIGEGVMLMAIIGPTLPDSITLNELTTISAAYSAAQFLAGAEIQGDSFALSIVAMMNANIVNIANGTSSTVLTSSPNADETNALRLTRSLGNFFATVVRGRELAMFYKLATPSSGAVPTNTIEALGNIARQPARNVGGIYLQSKTANVYHPALESQPDAWTIAVKVNDSGNDDAMFGGPGNLAFDKQGRAWIANNVIQGSGVSTTWSIVLEPDGSAASISPFTGGGLLGPGFGVDVDGDGNPWFGNFGWGKDFPNGGATQFNANAEPQSLPPDGYGAGVAYRVQGTLVDPSGNVWLASWGNGKVVVFPGGDGNATPIVYPPGEETIENFAPFGIAIAADGTAWVTSSASPSTITHLQLDLTNNQLTPIGDVITIGQTLKGIVIDSAGNIWTGSGGDDHVYAFKSDGTLIGGYQGGGMVGPWGITLDGADNVWVANFGPLEPGSVHHGRVTQLAGINATGRLFGDGLTPQTGYTLPSAGSQVLLHNGVPLYGENAPACYIPMTRTTGLKVDAAGNVWTCNNWKPSFDMDVFGDPFNGIAANPGGDGIVIFIGVATPVTSY